MSSTGQPEHHPNPTPTPTDARPAVPATASQASLVHHLAAVPPQPAPPAPAPAPARRPRRLRRRHGVRWSDWFLAKFYTIKIVLSSPNGRLAIISTWSFIQIAGIIALLVLSTKLRSPVQPEYNQWQACARHLQVFCIIQVFKTAIEWTITSWWLLRPPADGPPTERIPRFAYRVKQDVLPYFTVILHINLSALLFSTLNQNPTSYATAPTIFYACVLAVARTWLAVAEIVMLVVGGAIYAICYASLAIFCPSILPRRAARLSGINPSVGPLSMSQINNIPVVQYASMSTISLALPVSPPRTRERLRLKRDNTAPAASAASHSVPLKRHKIEKHRAACAICLNDFVDYKRANLVPYAPLGPLAPTAPIVLEELKEPAAASSSAVPAAADSGSAPTLTDDVERQPTAVPQPPPPPSPPPPSEPEELRLLPCQHVFHKECIDPWLKDVSGRCPTCQRPVLGETGDRAV